MPLGLTQTTDKVITKVTRICSYKYKYTCNTQQYSTHSLSVQCYLVIKVFDGCFSVEFLYLQVHPKISFAVQN